MTAAAPDPPGRNPRHDLTLPRLTHAVAQSIVSYMAHNQFPGMIPCQFSESLAKRALQPGTNFAMGVIS
jgi:hypothetical protein